MNGPLQGLVWNAKLPNNQKFLLALMAWYADSKGERIFPSVGTLAEQLNKCDRQVRRVLRELEQAGYVERMIGASRPGYTFHYRIVPETLYPLQRKTKGSPAQGRTLTKPGHSESLGRTFATRTPDISRTTPDIQMSAKIAIEHETEIENTVVEAWEKTSANLKATMDPHTFDTWIKPLRPDSMNGEVLFLKVPGPVFEEMGKRLASQILESAKQTGISVSKLSFVVRRADYE